MLLQRCSSKTGNTLSTLLVWNMKLSICNSLSSSSTSCQKNAFDTSFRSKSERRNYNVRWNISFKKEGKTNKGHGGETRPFPHINRTKFQISFHHDLIGQASRSQFWLFIQQHLPDKLNDRINFRSILWNSPYFWTCEIMPMLRLELATPGLQTQCSSHWALQLKSYCWEGVEFIQLVYCIIIYLSFLNCDWLPVWEV